MLMSKLKYVGDVTQRSRRSWATNEKMPAEKTPFGSKRKVGHRQWHSQHHAHIAKTASGDSAMSQKKLKKMNTDGAT